MKESTSLKQSELSKLYKIGENLHNYLLCKVLIYSYRHVATIRFYKKYILTTTMYNLYLYNVISNLHIAIFEQSLYSIIIFNIIIF